MRNFVSGLDLATSRELLGDDCFDSCQLDWLDPDEILAMLSEGTVLADRRVIWLYRSPARSAICGASKGDPEAVLGQWLARNRSILKQRREYQRTLYLVNADALSIDDFISELASVPRIMQGSGFDTTLKRGGLAAIEHLLKLSMPEHWEVYEMLEASSRFRSTEFESLLFTVPNKIQLLTTLTVFRDCMAANKKITEENSDLLLDLHKTQEEFERLNMMKIALEKELDQMRSAQESLRAEYLARAEASELPKSSRITDLEAKVVQEQAVSAKLREEGQALSREVERLKHGARLTTKRMLAIAGIAAMQHRRRNAGSWVPAGVSDSFVRRRDAKDMRRALAAIGHLPWFDRNWYLEQYPDVRKAGFDPVGHYHEFGWKEGRNPSPDFDTVHYLMENPDVVASGMNPLLHFVLHGEAEGRLPRNGAERNRDA